MTEQNNQKEKIPNFKNAIFNHSFLGIIEFILIIIAIFIYISNIVFLILCLSISNILLFILGYTLITNNPFYYIACVILIVLTIFPSAIVLIIFIGSTPWAYEPIKIFIIFALIIELAYAYFLIKEISYNKYVSYFHNIYMMGSPMRVGSILRSTYYSVKDFDKIDKERQYWQDQDLEDVKKSKKELKKFEKRFKKKFLIVVQILGVLTLIATFYLSSAF